MTEKTYVARLTEHHQPEPFNFEKLYRSARICSQLLAAKCLQAGESSPLSKHLKRKML
jgi:hypothetical protein